MVSAGICFGGKGRLHLIPNKTKVIAKFYVETLLRCCQNLFKIADLFCHLASSFNRTARLHTRQSWLKTGLLPTAVNSLVKINGLRTRLTSTLLTTISGKLCLNATIISTQPEDIDKLKKVLQMGPSATRLDQQSHIELPEKTSGLCESWWWTLRTYAEMITVSVS